MRRRRFGGGKDALKAGSEKAGSGGAAGGGAGGSCRGAVKIAEVGAAFGAGAALLKRERRRRGGDDADACGGCMLASLPRNTFGWRAKWTTMISCRP